MPNKTINSKAIIAAATKVSNAWRATPALFAAARLSQAEYDAKLQATAAAAGSTALTRETVRTERMRLRAVEHDQKLAATAARKAAEEALVTQLDSATTEESALVHELSRLTNGIKYTAKAVALSDEDEVNDEAAKRL